MEAKKRMYARFLLTRCISINEGEPLLLSYNTEQKDFVNIIKEEAKKIGVSNIYDLEYDANKTREILMNSTLEEIEKNPYFDRSIVKEVYDANGSMLFLDSYSPSRLNDISSEKKNLMNKVKKDTQKDALEARRKYKFPYSIAAVATKEWADELFPNTKNNLDLLWNVIFDITLINTENPIEAWEEKIKNNTLRRNYLNELKLVKLKYTNKLGTDFSLELPQDVIWWGAAKKSFDGKKDLITNVPTEEVYTTPLKYSANGIVCSTKPLIIKGKQIDKFKLTFENGKVVKVWASNDDEKILEMLEELDGMRYLGECALVDYNSPISNANMVFKTILIDENASCHLALGDGFPKTIPGGDKLTFEKLISKGMNRVKNHVDFMIGSPDLSIVGTDIYGNDVPIFIDGDFALEEVKSFLKKRGA